MPTPTPRQPVIVRFRPTFIPPYDDSAATGLGAAWSALLAVFPAISLRRRIRSVPASVLHSLAGSSPDPGRPGAAALLRTFEVECPAGIDPAGVAAALRLWPIVESAYVQPSFRPAGIVTYRNNPLWQDQGYLQQAPTGVNAMCAWQLNGGDGSGRVLVDIEAGWGLDHRDLPGILGTPGVQGVIDPTPLYGTPSGDAGKQSHGLMTLGVICAADNMDDCIGLAPAIDSVRLASYLGPDPSDEQDLENAILAATEALLGVAGAVILIEVELGATAVPPGGCVDLVPGVRHAIRAAVDAGIVVVEAAGNGRLPLKTTPDYDGVFALDTSRVDFHSLDSGAILVGGATYTLPHARYDGSWGSNYGSRVNVYAWGEQVMTLSGTTGNNYFDGTSSSAAIIAGVVVLVQGLAERNLGAPFEPFTLRSYLEDPDNGTESANHAIDEIGVMPDIAKIVKNLITSAVPDVYARDFVGDDGTTSLSSMCSSPDVIVRQSPVADPQASFGEGSGHEDDDALSDSVVSGKDHWVYLRARNRGGVDGVLVEARAYFADLSTLLLPDSWTEIGETVFPLVPTGDVLTVSPAIPWPAAQVPPTGHYCFVAEIVDPCLPTSAKVAMATLDEFIHFVRNENNVVWRNFNVITYPAPNPQPTAIWAWVPSPRVVKPRQMRVMLDAALPRDATVRVRAPFAWLGQTLGPSSRMRAMLEDGMEVTPCGNTLLVSGFFPPGEKTKVELVVTMSRQEVPRGGTLALKHFDERGELGRVTWRFEPEGDRR